MKMLFPPADHAEVKLVKKRLSEAGVTCSIRENPIAEGVYGTPPYPELWIENESHIIKALRLIGSRRLSQMTIIFPQA
jgi:hypothetical protein